MMESFMKIAVYCGASVGNEPSFATAAQELGQWIASRKNTLVYGGGKAGLMGVLADAVLENGGQVIGVIPTFLKDRELAHPGLTELYVVETMSERKRKMFELSQAFVALPGGPGTLEEITEMISWSRIAKKSALRKQRMNLKPLFKPTNRQLFGSIKRLLQKSKAKHRRVSSCSFASLTHS